MKFIADNMLGRLARWLRLLGFDVLYPGVISDNELLKMSGDRIILTRDKNLRNKKNVIIIETTEIDKQIKDVIKKLDLKITDELTRCSVCNTILEEIAQSFVKDKVPENVYKTHENFWYCNRCERIYWGGSHYKK